MCSSEIEKFSNIEQLSRAAAERIAGEIAAAVHRRGMASMVLAGGKTPAMTYGMLAADYAISWERVHLFFGDERWLPAEHPESNFLMVKKTLLDKISLPEQNLHAIDYNAESPEKAASRYNEKIKDFLYSEQPAGGWAYFDLTILGMGEDGHTASLFPGRALLEEKKLYAAAVSEPAGKPMVPRISMTYPALARSRKILFLIGGVKKETILNDILQGRNCDLYPAAAVRAVEEVRWLVVTGPGARGQGEKNGP